MENNDSVLRQIENILQGLQKESNTILERLNNVNELVALLEKKSAQDHQSEKENFEIVNTRIEVLENKFEIFEKQHSDLSSVTTELEVLKSKYSCIEPVDLNYSTNDPALIDSLHIQLERLSERITALELKLASSDNTAERIIQEGNVRHIGTAYIISRPTEPLGLTKKGLGSPAAEEKVSNKYQEVHNKNTEVDTLYQDINNTNQEVVHNTNKKESDNKYQEEVNNKYQEEVHNKYQDEVHNTNQKVNNNQNFNLPRKQDKATSTCDIFVKEYSTSKEEVDNSANSIKAQERRGSQLIFDDTTKRQLQLAERLNRPDLFLDILSNSRIEISDEKVNDRDAALKRVEARVAKATERIAENEKCTISMKDDIRTLEKKVDRANECFKTLLETCSAATIKNLEKTKIQSQPTVVYTNQIVKKQQQRRKSNVKLLKLEDLQRPKPDLKSPKPRPHRCNF